MRLATILDSGAEVPVIVDPDRGVVPVTRAHRPRRRVRAGRHRGRVVPTTWSTAADAADASSFVPVGDGALHRALPPAAQDLGHRAQLRRARGRPVRGRCRTEPASFIKGDHTIIGTGDDIPVPPQSERVTAEGELGLVIGRECRNVSEEDALDYVFGVTTDPRPDGGGHPAAQPALPDPLEELSRLLLLRARRSCRWRRCARRFGDIADVEVSTVVNGDQARTNTVANMRYCAGVPGGVPQRGDAALPRRRHLHGHARCHHVRAGDVAECRIPGIGLLVNPVVDG